MGRGGSPSTKPPANRSPHGPEKLHQDRGRSEPRGDVLSRGDAVQAAGRAHQPDRHDGPAFPGSLAPEHVAVGVEAVRTLLRLHADGSARRTDLAKDWLRARPHFWADPRFARLRWVRAGRGYRAIQGVPGGRMRRGDGPHGTGNRGQSRSRVPRIEGHAVFRINLAQSFNGFGRGTGPKSARSFSTPPRAAPRRPASLSTFRICSSACLWSCYRPVLAGQAARDRDAG